MKIFFVFVSFLLANLSYATPKLLVPLLDEKGASPSYIELLAEDKDGFLWAMDSFILRRFDGYTFESVLGGLTPSALFIDSRDRVWVSSPFGLHMLDMRRQETAVFNDFSDENEAKKQHSVFGVVESEGGMIIVATSFGLSLFDEATKTLRNISVQVNTRSGLQAGAVHTVEFVDSDTVLVAGEHGVYALGLQELNDSVERIILRNRLGSEELSRGIITIDTGRYVFLHATGFTLFDAAENIARRYTSPGPGNSLQSYQISSAALMDANTLLLGSNRGLEAFSFDTEEFHPGADYFRLPGDEPLQNVTYIYFSDDIRYIATLDALYRVGPSLDGDLSINGAAQRPELSAYDNALKNIAKVWSIHESPEYGLTVGTLSGGAYFLGENGDVKKATRSSAELLSDSVGALFVDRDGAQWIGTQGGLSYRKRALDPIGPLAMPGAENSRIRSIYQAQDTTIWVLSIGWLGQFSADAELLKMYDFNSTPRMDCKSWASSFVLLEHAILVGCENGLVLLDRRSGAFIKRYDTELVLRIYRDSKANLWVLDLKNLYSFNEQTSELVELQPTQYFSMIEDAGFINIIEDQYSQLWISYNGGIVGFDPVTHTIIEKFEEEGGFDELKPLFGNDSMILSQSGKILLGDIDGIKYFEPVKLTMPASPKVSISKIAKTFDRESESLRDLFNVTSITESPEVPVRISHKLEKIDFEFSDLDVASPSATLYQYYLEGAERTWNDFSARRTVSFPGLKAGSYTLHLRSLKNFQYSDTLEYPFVILSHPLLSIPAKIFYAMVVFFLAVFLVRLRNIVLQRKVDRLELRVAQRTKELVERNNDVERLLSDKEILVENIFHQTRTPIQLLIANMDELKTGALKITDYIDKQANNVCALVELTDRVLKKGHQDDETFYYQNLDLLFTQYVDKYSLIAKNKRIEFIKNVESPVNLVTNSVLMGEIVDNLLSNSFKYTHAGYVKLTITLATAHLSITVEDSGIGIEKDDLARILQRGYRGESASDKTGSGIGLAIVRENIARLQGKLSVESAKNQGATFRLAFPIELPATNVKDQSLASTAQATAFAKNEDTELKTFGDMRPEVLLIEDNVELSRYYTKVLKDDYAVTVVHSGEDAIEFAVREVPDIVISDVMMGVLSGFDVVRALRQNAMTRHIPSILLTAKADQRSKLHGFNSGANDYIVKPVQPYELSLRVRNQLNLVRNVERHIVSGRSENDPAHNGDELAEKFLSLLKIHYADTELTTEAIADMLYITKRQLERKVKQVLGNSPKQCLIEHRLTQAKRLLSAGDKVSRVYELCGFSSHAYFSKKFKEKYGYTPSSLASLEQLD